MQIMTIFTKYWERIVQMIILFAVITTLWLNSRYVTIDQYNADNKEARTEMTTRLKDYRNESIMMIDKVVNELDTFNKDNASQHVILQTSIADIATTLKIMAVNQKQLEDHEQRLRFLESKFRVN